MFVLDVFRRLAVRSAVRILDLEVNGTVLWLRVVGVPPDSAVTLRLPPLDPGVRSVSTEIELDTQPCRRGRVRPLQKCDGIDVGDDLVESGALLVTDSDEYVPDPTRAYFDHLRELILTNDREELRGELEAIADRIEEWQTAYGVESPDELEATLADDHSPEEIRERRRALRRWENSRQSRDIVRTALRLYDDIESLTDGVPGNTGLEGTG